MACGGERYLRSSLEKKGLRGGERPFFNCSVAEKPYERKGKANVEGEKRWQRSEKKKKGSVLPYPRERKSMDWKP